MLHRKSADDCFLLQKLDCPMIQLLFQIFASSSWQLNQAAARGFSMKQEVRLPLLLFNWSVEFCWTEEVRYTMAKALGSPQAAAPSSWLAGSSSCTLRLPSTSFTAWWSHSATACSLWLLRLLWTDKNPEWGWFPGAGKAQAKKICKGVGGGLVPGSKPVLTDTPTYFYHRCSQ